MVSQSTLLAKILKSLELAAAVLQAFTALIKIIYQMIFHILGHKKEMLQNQLTSILQHPFLLLMPAQCTYYSTS